MWSMISEMIKKGSLQLIVLLAGILFLFLSMFSIQDITKAQIAFSPPVRFIPFFFGIAFIFLAFLWNVISDLGLPHMRSTGVRKIQDGFQIQLNQTIIRVSFGRLEDLYQRNTEQVVVVLPASNLFDDECIKDKRGAMGSFVDHRFPDQIQGIISQLAEQLKRSSETVGPPYEIGTCVYFDKPLGVTIRMAFVAVTTVEKKLGITCEPRNLFNAIQGIHTLMNEKKIYKTILPLFGCGHGGMPSSISLICMLLAFAEASKKPAGGHLQEVNIVVFRNSEKDAPQISPFDVKKLLAFVKKCYLS